MEQASDHVFAGMDGQVIPGFVDIQVNGGFGLDFTEDPGTIWDVAARLPVYGVTAFLPTVISSSAPTAVKALEVLATGPPAGWVGAQPLGIHLEGPMISAGRRGTHLPSALIPPTKSYLDQVLATGTPRMVTLAPELPGAEAAISALKKKGTIVAAGHSDATSTEARRAFEWGVTHVTHLFNAMSGLAHRDPGLVAAVLDDRSITAGVICDGFHVAPELVRLAWRLLGPDRIALVTDAMAAIGVGDGSFHVGSVPVEVRGIEVRNQEGKLAGSAATMDHVFRTMIDFTGCSLEDAVAMSSTTPSRIVGYSPDAGDLVLVDDELRVVATAVGGRVVYRRPNG
jgi:N-acetylglucosamine-6-phosphate deacetylase